MATTSLSVCPGPVFDWSINEPLLLHSALCPVLFTPQRDKMAAPSSSYSHRQKADRVTKEVSSAEST